MFKKIMTAGIMCLALANSATAQGAAGAGWCCVQGGS